MEGHVCNIQVLLRAAEFLERRERGQCFMSTVSLERTYLVVTKNKDASKITHHEYKRKI